MRTARAVVTIGTFDGVHAGHAALVRRARQIADGGPEATRVVAIALDPHPMTVLAPDRAPQRLSTFEQRAEWLGGAGADEVIRLEPTGNLLAMAPQEFVREIVQDFNPTAFVEGEDFRFGRGRAGNVETLRELGDGMGFSVEVVAPIEVALTDGTLVKASSTIARWLLGHGRALDAATVLGRPYELVGTVEQGDQRGRKIDFPTANLVSECMAPGDGVYAGHAVLEDGRAFAAAISVGTKPTFDDGRRAVEAFLMMDGAGGTWQPIPGLPEYGWRMHLQIEHWVREQVRFDSVRELVEQMRRDCERVRAMVGHKEAACR
jgi:riboflavin kinase/FMN adenylyltransferase